MARRLGLPSGRARAAWGLLVAVLLAPAALAAQPAPDATAADTATAAAPEAAPSPPADPAAARLARLVDAYRGVRTITASFSQQTRFAGFPRPRTYLGRVELERPDRMRWSYHAGSAQQVYVNGRTVIVYVPEAKQAVESTLTPASDQQVPLHLLADVTHIDETYNVAAGPDPDELVLTPKAPDPAAPETVNLWLDPDTGLIARVHLSLPGGSRSDLRFSNVQTNGEIPADRFTFVAPPGTHRVNADALMPSGGTR
jgi:outer membrane lipoprotein carrier protein